MLFYLDILRLLVDMGLFILIWIVQLIIYPGFIFYQKSDLENWHKAYTPRITYIVGPLMIFQVILVFLQLFRKIELYTVVSCLFTTFLWILTFLYFVPNHQKIAKHKSSVHMINQMIAVNWIRTSLWTLLFLYSLYWFVNHYS